MILYKLIDERVNPHSSLLHYDRRDEIDLINFKIMKIDAKTLSKNNFDITLTYEEAEKQLMIIGLSQSQVIDWCLEARGTDYKTVSEKVIEIKKKGKRDSRNKINELVFLDEILQVVIGSKRDFDTIMRGFKVNGHGYKYLASKGSSEITFVRDDLYELFTDRLNANRNMDVKMYSAKLNAYRSLALSSSEVVSSPKKVIVMKDCNVKFNADYLWVDETIEHRNEEVERCINDGCFFISPQLARVWSDELNHPEKVISAFQIRFLWTKGIVYTVNFHTWCEEHDCEYVTDIWGEQHRIEDVDLILGENMVKLWSSYSSCDEWLASAKEHHYDWRVSKYSKPIKMNNMNYQELLPLNLTYEDVRELLTPSIEHLKQISGNNYESMLLYLNGVTTMDRAVKREGINGFAQALAIEPRLMHDKFLLNKVSSMISTRRNSIKLGEVQIDALSSYQIIVSDPIQLLEHLIGIENPKGVLKRYEAYSYNHEEGTVVVASRAPLLVANNLIKVTTRKDMGEYNKYFEYLQDIYAMDGVSLINESLCGYDQDGDTLQFISTDVIVRNCKDLLPIKCASINGKKVVCTEQELIKSAKLCVGNSIPNIGAEINKASSMFCIMNRYEEGTPQREEMERRLIQAVKITQSVIDAKKANKFFPYPKEWISKKAVEALDDGEYKDLCRELLADKKPYFMMYRYDKEKKEYMDKYEEFNTKALINFGKTLDEVLNSDNRTEREQLLVDLFMQQIPFYYDNTTMFRVTTIAEEMLKEVKYTTKSDNSTKELLKSDVIATKEQKKAIKELFMDMCSEMSAVHQQDMSCLSLDERKDVRINATGEIKDKYYYTMLDVCNGDKEVCLNCLIDVIYSSNKSATMLWEYFSDIIVENLLKRNDYKVNTMIEDTEGNIEYLGKRYSMQTVRVEK